MRVVVQRVAEAEVAVAGEIVGRIGHGVVALVGLARGDREDDLAWMARKAAGLRIFADPAGAMNLALGDVGGAVLAVSQFTLLGDCSKGKRPSFAAAMPPADAARAFDRFVELLAAEALAVATGRFGAAMRVRLVNDGPVTLVLDR
jgi:D-tyrosyl-tRNA(Tyr) deacylase